MYEKVKHSNINIYIYYTIYSIGAEFYPQPKPLVQSGICLDGEAFQRQYSRRLVLLASGRASTIR
jgi:hypothetical protein